MPEGSFILHLGNVVLVIFRVKHLASSVEGTCLLGLFCQFAAVLSCKVAEEDSKKQGFQICSVRLRGISHDSSPCSSWCLLLWEEIVRYFFYQSFCHLCSFSWFSESFWKRSKVPTEMKFNSQNYHIFWLLII